MNAPYALVIGESLIDIVHRIDGQVDEHAGGSPMNVAVGLARLGREVELATSLADDEHGQLITDHLARDGVRLTQGAVNQETTSTAIARLSADGRTQYEFNLEWDVAIPERGSSCQVIHTGSLGAFLKPGVAAVAQALDAARGQALRTYDPNARPHLMGEPSDALRVVEDMVAKVDVVKVSDEDIEWLTGGEDPLQVVAQWLERGPGLIVLTRGPEGALARTASGLSVAAIPGEVEVADTVGAGDSFMSGLIDGLWAAGISGPGAAQQLADLSQAQLQAIMDRASRISDITVSRQGANPPTLEEIGGPLTF